jgi:hypothetical protein
MSFASDISSVSKTATSQAVNGRSRLAGMYFTHSATPATITLKSGGSGGTTLMTMTSPAAAGSQDMIIPDNGILFPDGIHITLSSAEITSVTLLFVGGAAA